MGTIGTSPDAERLAGLLADLGHKIQHGSLTLNELALFTQRKNPFSSHLRRVGMISVRGYDSRGQAPETDAIPFDSHERFRTRDGLCVWSEFKDWILSATTLVYSVPAGSIATFDLAEPMTDDDIIAERGNGHIFEDARVFCVYLDEIIERQKDGENVGENGLLVNGYANTAHVRGSKGEVFAVAVRWPHGDREWRVRARRRDDYPWPQGYRILSGTC